jgi:hypothetical protein
MADLVITAASVVAGSDSITETGTLGETVTAGQAVYKAASGLWMLADNDSVTTLARNAKGIALNGGAINQPVKVHKSGDITIGATVTVGATYWLSNTAGGICPDADVGTGEYACLLGIAKSASVLAVDIQFPNVARA